MLLAIFIYYIYDIYLYIYIYIYMIYMNTEKRDEIGVSVQSWL